MNLEGQKVRSGGGVLAYLVDNSFAGRGPSVLFLIDLEFCKIFLEKLRKLIVPTKEFPKLFSDKATFHNAYPKKPNKIYKFGFDIFGFRVGEVYRSNKYLHIKIDIIGVGIKDTHFTLFAVFTALVNSAKKQTLNRSPEIELLSSIQVFHKAGTLFGTYPNVPKSGEKVNLIERMVTDVMNHTWMSLVLHEKESKIAPDCKVTISRNGEFGLFCSYYKACNVVVDLNKKGNLKILEIDVSNSIMAIVLYVGLAKLCSIVSTMQ